MLSMIDALNNRTIGNEYWREGALTEKWDNIVVDTIMTVFDTGKAETGICIDDGIWVIVEQYETPEEAKIGHEKWIASMKENPKQELHDINVWG